MGTERIKDVPARPIVMRVGALGDMVLILPFLRQMADYHKGPVDLIGSGAWTRSLLEYQSCIHSVNILTSRNAPYWINRSQQRLVAWLRQRREQPIYLCETDKKSLSLARRAGMHKVYWAGDIPSIENEHWLERWNRAGHAWTKQESFTSDPESGHAPMPSTWLELPPGAKEDCKNWLAIKEWTTRPIVLLQPGNKRTMRRGAVDRASNKKFWPDRNWKAVCDAILKKTPEAQVLLCGSQQEAVYLRALENFIARPQVQSVADELPIPRLLALQSHASSMISVDTGPAHTAAALGCPLVVLFGGASVSLWKPRATIAAVKVCEPLAGNAMANVSPDAVIKAWQDL